MLDQTLTEAQAEKLFAAFKLAKKHFPKVPANELLEALTLCLNNHGLFVSGEYLMACFFYDPREKVPDGRILGDVIADFDVPVLKACDLTRGMMLHIVGFAAPKDGYRGFRTIIRGLNPWAISFHRLTKHGRRFGVLKNVHFKHPQNGGTQNVKH